MSSPTMEELVVRWLKSDTQLETVPVRTALPADSPSTIITVEQTGGRYTYSIRTYLMTVLIYAPTQYEASQLANNTVVPRLLDMWHVPQVAGVSVESVAHDPLAVTPPRERYRVTLQITAAAF